MSLLSFTFIACSNDDDTTDRSFNGTYTGTFSVTYENGDTFSNPVSVTFNGQDNYSSTGNSSRIPAGGSGTYVKENTTISFHDINTWTADFDWNLVLDGTYDYSLTGTHLIISAHKNDLALYTYDLIKE